MAFSCLNSEALKTGRDIIYNTMIKATDKPWNSPTTLYIARRLASLSKGRSLSVLDMGCGDGTVLEYLVDYAYDLYGYDLPKNEMALKNRLSPYFGESFKAHIRMAKDDRSIPFEDHTFDVIYANQVFEHIRFLDRMLQECTRVLKPGGVLLTIFPMATCPIEQHIGIPFAHWLPPGHFRVRYLRLFYALGLRPKSKNSTSLETAIQQDLYLRHQTFYRFMNEILSLFEYHFESYQCETNLLIQAKLDLMKMNQTTLNRFLKHIITLFPKHVLMNAITHFMDAAFCVSSPKFY